MNGLQLKDTTLSNTPSPEYRASPPWKPPPAIFNVLDAGTRKADWNPHELRQLAERKMEAVAPQYSTVCYTDGSVDPSDLKTGAAFIVEGGDTVL